jgi:tRNA G46 methylase TrmB
MKNKLKSTLANILVVLFPKKAENLNKRGLTIPMGQKLTSIERLMRTAIMKRAENKDGMDTLAEIHHNFWTDKGADFFSQTNHQFEDDFLKNCAFIFDILKDELSKTEEKFNTIVEIGTGNGMVLSYLESKFPKIDKFIGIDLSASQISINCDTFKDNPRLEFVASDGFDWVKKHGNSHMIFVTSRGVLEYFTEETLKAFFNQINRLGKVIFVAIEPNGTDHNFELNPHSQVYGWERSFSHNYSKLFKDSGFEILHHSRKDMAHWGGIMNFIISKN